MTQPLHPVLPIGGVLLTIAFATMEYVIDLIQTEYYCMARAVRDNYLELRRATLLGVRPEAAPLHGAIALGSRLKEVSDWNRRVRYPIWGIFGLVIGVWFDVIIEQCKKSPRESGFLHCIACLLGLS